jgi:hypothetical protein
MDLVIEKAYPQQYPPDAVKVLNTMSFTKGKGVKIMGSASLVSQKYSGDYDGYEIVEGFTKDELVGRFKEIIRDLQRLPNTYIGDIKAGLVEDWKVDTEDFRSGTTKVESLFSKKIISSEEAKLAKEILSKPQTKANKLNAKAELKFHIVRWLPNEILSGVKKLRDGTSYTLKEAIQSPTICKLDVISPVNDKYTDFSMIYEFYENGKILNPVVIEPEEAIKNDIVLYNAQGNKFKVIKRKFALAKLQNNKRDLEKYNKILNSNLGKLYVLYSDVKTLADVVGSNNTSPYTNKAIADFSARLSSYDNTNETLVADLRKATQTKERSKVLSRLRHAEDQLFKQLNSRTLTGGFVYIPFSAK